MGASPRRRTHLGVLALFAALAIGQTWPLASDPGGLSRNNNADTILNEWIVAWVAHQAIADPARLWQANIFYPEPNTLAFSEPLLTPAAIGAPLLWAGQSPVLVYNVLVLIGLTLMGWSMYLAVSKWTGDTWAGVLGGVIFAFNAHTLTRLPHLQALHMQFVPLALLMFDRLLTIGAPLGRRVKYAALLATCVVLQGAASYYALVLLSIAVAAGWLARPEDWANANGGRAVAALAIAAGVAVMALLPVLLPYRELGHLRTIDDVARYSATPSSYLASPARMHYSTWSAPWFAAGGDTALFPGVTAVVLGTLAIANGAAWRRRQARMALAFGALGVALSFGPQTPGFSTLFTWLPPLQGARNAARYGFLLTIALAVLSGFALAWIRQRWMGRTWLLPATAAAIVLANLDALAAPIGYVPPQRVASLHASLRGTDAIVAHIPFYPPAAVFRNAQYMLESTANWRPMLNGYSGYTPDSYVEHARGLAGFPDARAMDTLRAAGVTHVFVHHRALRPETLDAIRQAAWLEPVARESDLTLYRVRR